MKILLGAQFLKQEFIKEAIKQAKASGDKIVEFIAEPLIGAYLTLNTDDYDKEGNELSDPLKT